MVIAVAAGNSGPGHYTVESPGSAARALTAGASTVGHFVGRSTVAAPVGHVPAVARRLRDGHPATSRAPLGVVTGGGIERPRRRPARPAGG